MTAISKTPGGSFRGSWRSQPLDTVIDVINGLTGNATPTQYTPQFLTAAGTSQGTAAQITTALAIITVATTVSTRGVKLPAAATGLVITVGNGATFGSKVYPFLGDKIGAAATNAADSTTLAINKANRYIAVNSVNWIVERGA